MHRHLSLVPLSAPTAETDDAEAELRRLRQVVVHLTKLSAVGDNVAMLVHEIAQPVTAATNYLAAAQQLLAETGSKTKDRALQAVELAQDSLLRTAEIMRGVTEAASNKAFRSKALDLHVIIADVMKIYAGTWELTPRVTLSSSACHVMGDRVQLGQVLSNLIKNAIEATDGQSERRLSVSSRLAEDRMVEIRVQDNGPGIPSAMSGKLFSAFSGTKVDGLGVGLSICRAIIEQHQGRIWAEVLTDGTAFCFTLPAAPALSAI